MTDETTGKNAERYEGGENFIVGKGKTKAACGRLKRGRRFLKDKPLARIEPPPEKKGKASTVGPGKTMKKNSSANNKGGKGIIGK